FLQSEGNLCTQVTVTLSGSIVRNNVGFLLNGRHAEAHLHGLYLPKESSHIDNQTFVDHAVPQCYSNELYKGIMRDKATGVFNGKILVRQDAQKTNAYQSNKNILLSKEAHINTKPQLEIFADDVKCSHGATIGQLDEDAVFYLRARGLDEHAASVLLTHAFALEVLEHIPSEPLRTYLDLLVEAELATV
nr:SufD family Fe-S cluster assembly protein [Bacteroidota bacterium]